MRHATRFDHTSAGSPRRPRHTRGFTLIELLAVVVIIGLTLAVLIPNLTATRHSRLALQARAVAARLELARERAIATGLPHRVLIDLEAGRYWVEWFTSEDTTESETQWSGELPAAVRGPDSSPSLSPPPDARKQYRPIPGAAGGGDDLANDYYFVGAQTPDGWIESGEVQIVFDWDGSSDYAQIAIADAWDEQLELEVRPLLDTVRIHEHAIR